MTKLAHFAAFCVPIALILLAIAYGLEAAPNRDTLSRSPSRITDEATITRLAEVIAKQQDEIRTTHAELKQLRQDATAAIQGLLREIEKLERQPGTKPSKLTADTLPTDF